MKFAFTKKTIHSKKGQGLIEYLILVALIAVGTMGVIKVVGQNVTKQYAKINRALGASGSSNIQIEDVSESQLHRKNLSNFLDGAR